MKVITLLTAGHIGGIETRCRDYALYSKHDNLVLILWGDGYVDSQMEKLGIRVINLHASRRNIIATIHKVMKIVREEKADVLMALHEAPMSHLCLMYAHKTIKNIRTIAYAELNAVDMLRSSEKKRLWLRKAVLKASLSRADDVIAISESVRQSLLDVFDTPKEKIRLIYNGTDLSRFPMKDEVSAPDETSAPSGDKLNLIFVGRLIPEKGVQDVLTTLSKMHDFKYHFNIVGDGPYREELETLSRELDLQDKVEFLGSRDDVPELLSASDVFIHMPRWEEGFGIAIIEAMSKGLICICAQSGAIPEIITDKVNGFLVEKGNPDQLAETLLYASRMTSGERDVIAKAAHSRAEDFSIEKYVKNLDDLISGEWHE
ncbi:MAG: glycosyltransferase family 4 protein [Lachnospiraceae bacterium]|nr:glycosyltransferase family 4 protein [Lachnospiraceae bacterium]